MHRRSLQLLTLVTALCAASSARGQTLRAVRLRITRARIEAEGRVRLGLGGCRLLAHKLVLDRLRRRLEVFRPELQTPGLRLTARRLLRVPSQIVALLNAPNFDPARLQSLEMLLSLGAPLSVAHKDILEAALPGRFYELYGLTEDFVTILDRDDAQRKRGTVGVPPPFFDMKIVREDGKTAAVGEIGEIVGRGPILMPGYYRRDDLTAEAIRDGWLYTGDLGFVDKDGYLSLVDRKKDMIDSGGVKVYPRDIEEIIVQHPAVLEAVVFGIPDEKWGETPAAVVTLKAGQHIDADALREWTNTRVGARYQRLSTLDFLDQFPRNAAGKILKRELREPYWEAAGRRI